MGPIVRLTRACAVALGAALACSVVLIGCSQSPNPPPPTSPGSVSDHNQQDIVFATQLTDLNEQLVALGDAVSVTSDKPETEASIDEMQRTAKEQSSQASALLKTWNAKAPDVAEPPGILTDAQLDALLSAPSAQFPSLLAQALDQQLSGMQQIAHAELTGGQSDAAKKLAQSVLDTAAAQVAALRQS